ncbi:MAG: thioredoxin family protein [Candidatus Ratteibacteria bacterium]
MKNKKSNISEIILVTIICIAAITIIIVNKTTESRYNQKIAASSKTYNAPEETKNTQLETGIKQPEQKKTEKKKNIPKLIDLGADKCVPCKMMAPVLEELKNQYQGKLEVEFIDVWKNSEAGDSYRIRLIPTQIFLDENGNELYRHEGFMSKQDILNKWNELGYKLEE